ncbi:hypothetical protein BDZ97DRAFT_1837850 [Flammula alnicola]|nr:hypothetical protein BDZ97DRAFT_1837850 [Flammula alnicola]
MSSSTTIQPANPFTPMAFLPPDAAFQLNLGIYVIVGTFSALIWDTLNGLRMDYLLLTRYRFSFPTAVYLVLRIFTFLYLFGLTYSYTAPVGVGKCVIPQHLVQVSFPIAISTTNLLFFLRARAVYRDNKIAIGLFTLTWLGVVGGSLLPSIAFTRFDNIGPTKYCIDPIRLGPSVSANTWPGLVNDLLLFCAITWRLVRNSTVQTTIKNTFRVIFLGQHLPALSRALLQDGQAYFLSIVVFYLFFPIIVFNPSIPLAYREIFPLPELMVANVMAGRIYRNTRLGIFRELDATSTINIPSTSTSCGEQSRAHTEPIAFRVDLSHQRVSGERLSAGGPAQPESVGPWLKSKEDGEKRDESYPKTGTVPLDSGDVV